MSGGWSAAVSEPDDKGVDRTLRSVLALVWVALGIVCLFCGVVGFFLAYAAFFPFGQTPVSAWAAIGPAIGALGLFVGAACVFPWATRSRSAPRG